MEILRPAAFEIGPIRPPSEAGSLLLRVTRNCPWNKCGFCRIYRKRRFETRPIEDIERDIDNIAYIRDTLRNVGMDGTARDYEKLRFLTQGFSQAETECWVHVLQWMSQREQTAFLQDANTMLLSYNKLMRIITHLKRKLPEITRITSYGRADALNRLSREQYSQLKQAGLDRIHSGFETGSDEVLRLINKGYTQQVEIEAGQKVKDAGIELSVYFMPGVGGRELSESNAVETANVISKVNPDFVRIRTFVSIPKTDLFLAAQDGSFIECTDMEKVLEIKRMLQSVTGADGMLYSDHAVNLLESIRGNLLTDKDKMISLIEAVENLPEDERRRFQIAQRIGFIRNLSQFSRMSAHHRQITDNIIAEFKTENDFEGFLLDIMRKYI